MLDLLLTLAQVKLLLLMLLTFILN